MAYTANEWNTGDVITAEKLNNLENGLQTATTTAATAAELGMVKQAAHVANAAGANPTQEEFDNLLAALIAAGIMAGS